MEGRRVTQRNHKYNPLFILFLCLVAAVFILLIVSIVFGVRLRSANKKLDAAQTTIQELNETVNQLKGDLALASTQTPTVTPKDDGQPALPGSSETPGVTPTTSADTNWLDLTGHSEVEVKPSTLLEGYATYYTTAGVNMRSGPATSYKRITTIDYGEKVLVAARENGWSFVKAENKFGWVSSDYLSTEEPGGGGTRSEATSGSIRR
ncbi:MAG: SH3 domain-containing protein [Oscillospiraceae bacterium]|nr:SH3 domain-containing protein [Oscillospiraceae bacterium]